MGNSLSSSKKKVSTAANGKNAVVGEYKGHVTPVAQFGSAIMPLFPIDPSYHNLNHGSFGSIPNVILEKKKQYQDAAEARPDPWIRYEYPKLLDESRAAVAKLLNAPTDTVVFVPNASTGVNTILRNLKWDADGKDEIIYFSTIYGGCDKTIDYIVYSNDGRVSPRCITLEYPVEDDEILAKFLAAVRQVEDEGKRPKLCLFDTVSSLPGVRFPFESIAAACKELGILSLVDGAQGIGMIEIDLAKTDPDFFVSNCHKWLHVPRGCAVFYVPVRNQHLMQSSIPTSHGYVPKTGARFSPLPPSSKSVFVNNFEFVGTLDNSSYVCVKDSIKWREEVLGGEKRILEYQMKLAKEGGKRVAEILGTWVLENKKGTLTDCAMVNVALPIRVTDEGADGSAADAANSDTTPVVATKDIVMVAQWMLRKLMDEHNTFFAFRAYNGRMWARLSAQVYLDMNDFEWTGKTLLDVCTRVGKGEHLKTN